ncbi:hypothetical protein [Cryptosporangium aurantiacum]|uniref:Mce-associated membrane protein n=1 Tax=Cryptosporangium aurantiacum TaxID=134849 RepID=A0A1M7PPU7_9ACTN|nr:hypothetical protein [Cryptosporangium aurantiacum]SHN19366.1 hypothetical protein SAMN05443668_103568 [Cryptosporangium aurantiacum]
MTLRPRRWSTRWIALSLALLIACTQVGCDRESEKTPAPSTASSASTDGVATRQQVKAAYDGWYDAFADAVTSGTYRREDFARYSVDPKLTATIKDLDKLRDLNVVYRGRPTWDAQVTSLNLDTKPPTAALRICLDMSKSTPVDKTTGENLKPAGELPRFVITASAKQLNGKWYLADSTTQRTTPC